LTIYRSRDQKYLVNTFVDADRNQTFQLLFEVPVGDPAHTLTDITLRDIADAQNTIYWQILNIHTWDIDFLSGQSLWSTSPARGDVDWEMEYGYLYNWLYGFSFARVIPAQPGVGS
jgi:hypothetical protein